MELTRLGVVIDPTEAVAGARKAKAAAADMATSMVGDLNKVEKESTEAGKAVDRAGETIERAARDARKEVDHLGSANGFDRLRQRAGAGFGELRRMVIDALDVFGLLNNGIGDFIRRGDSLLNLTENAGRGLGGMSRSASDAAGGLGAMSGATGGAAAGMGRMAASAGPLLAAIAAIAAAVIGAIALFKAFQVAIDFTTASVREAAALEQYTVRLAVLQGGFDKAIETVKRFNSFSDSTPFTDAEVFDAGTKLEAMSRGILSTDEALRAIGGSAFVAGKQFSEIAELVGRSYNALRLGLDFIEPLKTMNSYGLITGEAVKEVIRLGDEAEKTGNKAANFPQQWAIVYAELQKKQEALILASDTWEGKMSTIEGKWAALKATFGAPIMDALKPLLDDALLIIQMLTPLAERAGIAIGNAIKVFVQLFHEGNLSDFFVAAFLDATETIARFMLATFLQTLGYIANRAIDLFLLPFRLIADAFRAFLSDPGMVARFAINVKNALIEAVIAMGNALLEKAAEFGNAIKGAVSGAVSAVAPSGVAGIVSSIASGTSPGAAIVDAIGAKAMGTEIGQAVTDTVVSILPTSAAPPATAQADLEFVGPAKPAEPTDYFGTSLFPEDLVKNLEVQSSRTEKVITDALSAFDAANPAPAVSNPAALPTDITTPTPSPVSGAGGGATPSASAKPVQDVTAAVEQQRSAVQNLTDDWLNLQGQADQTLASMAQGIAGSVSQAITDGITGTKSWKEAFADLGTEVVRQIIQMITQMWIQYTVALLLKNVMGALPGGFGLFGGAATSVLHTGGGTEGAPVRSGVPFYHGGGKASSERLAMLEKGETVLTAEQGSEIRSRLRQGARVSRPGTAGSAGSSGTAVTILNVTDASQVADAVAANPDMIINAINRRLPAVKRLIGGDRR